MQDLRRLSYFHRKTILLITIAALFHFVGVSAQQSWSANWIWSSADGPKNTWLTMRKKVNLSSKPTSAITKIAAENKYWLYVNNKLVVSDGGLDARPDLNNTYYDEVDLAPHLVAGDNIIAVLVWYKGGYNGYSQMMVNKGGLLFESKLEGTNLTSIVSDNTWKVREHTAFNRGTFLYKYGISGTIAFTNANFGGDPIPGIAKRGYYRPVGNTGPFIPCANEGQSFTLPGLCDVAYGSDDNQLQVWNAWKWVAWPVSYDAQKEPTGWQALNYNDAAWTNAVQKGIPPVAPWNKLLPRTIPMWKDYGLISYQNQAQIPTTISSNTIVTGQLGINIQGTPYLKVNAPAGVKIKIVLNEYYWQEYITKAGEQEFECFQWQNSSSHTVRYEFSNVTGTVTIRELKFHRTSYNAEVIGFFSSNDDAINTLWTKSKNTSEVCMRDIFYDCPNRERGQWWGDVSEQIMYSFYLYDNNSNLLSKKAYREFLNTQKSDGSLYTTAPGTDFHLPDQNIAAMATLWTYYQYTGDRDLMVELYPQMKKFVQYCVNTSNNDGMLIMQPGVWNWIDWGGNMDIKEGSANAIVNASYIVMLDGLINIANLVGATADRTYYQGLQNKTKSNFNNYFWNGSSYSFHSMNGQRSATIDDRTQAWAVLAGMVDDSKKAGVLNVLKTRNDASPYQEMYVEMAMLQLDPTAAINRMKSRYTPMINSWSSTLWEEFPANNSNNHAWSAGPVYVLGGYALGIRPSLPAYSEFLFMPKVGGLNQLSANIPSAKGIIQASFQKDYGYFTQSLTSPAGTVATVGVPKHGSTSLEIRIGNTVIWKNGAVQQSVSGVVFYQQDAEYVMFKVQPGAWVFTSATGGSPDVVTTYGDCNYNGTTGGLSVGDYTRAQLIAKGIKDDDISSIRVMQGFKIIMYADDNFTGQSEILTTDNNCIAWSPLHDKTTSIRVQTNGSVNMVGTYYLQNRITGLSLDVNGAATNDGAGVIQSGYNGNDNQKFEFTHIGNGNYKVLAKHSGKSLNVDGSSKNNSARINQWTYNGAAGSPNQHFIVYATGDGFYKLIPEHSGQVLEVANNTNGGAPVYQWTNINQQIAHWKFTPVIENPLPVVAITAPSNGATFNAPTTITISATASDNGSISKVEFYNGTQKIGDDASAPYSVTWSNVAAGTYSITAKATDNQNATSVSTPVSVTVKSANGVGTFFQHCDYSTTGYSVLLPLGSYTTAQMVAAGIRDNDLSSVIINSGYQVTLFDGDNFTGTSVVLKANTSCLTVLSFNDRASSLRIETASQNQLPVVSITSPASGTNYSAPASITFTATASDADGSVTKVEFFNGTNRIGEDATSPYAFTWSNVTAGNYAITAKATDNAAGVTTSSVINIVVTAPVNQLPSVSIASPANNANYNAPANITFTASASDNDGTISKVEYFNGITSIGSATISPYSVSWNNVSAGTYTITARATDNANATTTSAASTIVVNVVNTGCALPQYVENSGYVAGSKVKNAGRQYECKEWPYSGWCNGASWAYAPGSGAYWTDAWYDRGTCTGRVGDVNDEMLLSGLQLAPNPAGNDITIYSSLDLNDARITVLNALGEIAIESRYQNTIDVSGLPSGVYTMIVVTNNNEHISKMFVKQ